MNLLKGLKLKGKVLHDEPLSRHTTFRIGGPARTWAEIDNTDDLIAVLEFSKAEGLPIFLFGEGSNLLISDEGLGGIAVSLKGSFRLFKIGTKEVSCGAGSSLQQLILSTIESGYSGLEFMAGIPGTVGGAIRMNAGAGLKGPWISDFIYRIKALKPYGTITYLEKADFRFGYRESNLQNFIILEAWFRLKNLQDKDIALKEYKRFLAEKKDKQELSKPSAGCVFKNPAGPLTSSEKKPSAAELIEGCGFKGKRIGDAMVSEKHANFIINLKKASFRDVMNLIELIREKVLKKYKIALETEIEIIK